MNSRIPLLALVTALAACGARTGFRGEGTALVGDATADTPPTDATVDATPDAPPPDASTTPECVTAADCARLGPRERTRWCESSWSCIAGYCTWECNGGRTCALDAAGCVACPMPWGTVCPAARCNIVFPAQPRIEEVFCTRPFLQSIERCFGEWVRLNEGRYCSVTDLPTGAQRALLACGGCQSVFMW